MVPRRLSPARPTDMQTTQYFPHTPLPRVLALLAVVFAIAAGADALELTATDVFFRTQPGTGDRIERPVSGQVVYAHVSFSLDQPISGSLFAIDLDGVELCSVNGSSKAGTYNGWCNAPLTPAAGAHTLTGRVDPGGDHAEVDENDNTIERSYLISGEAKASVSPPTLRLETAALGSSAAASRTVGDREPAAASNATPELFLALRPAEPIPRLRATLATRRVDLQRGPLARGAERLVLPLPNGATHVLRRTGGEHRGGDDFTWSGVVEGSASGEAGRAVIAMHHGAVAGRFETPDGLFELRTLADGTAALAQLDPSLFLGCAGGVEPQPGTQLASQRGAAAVGVVDPPDRVDLLALYTAAARAAAGGKAAVEATIQASVEAANAAFADSGMALRFRLVHSAEVGYTGAGDLTADLSWLSADAAVAALRDAHAADLVSLLVEPGDGCGQAYVMREPAADFAASGFQVTRRDCALGNLSFAHEHGHNLGMEHDPPYGVEQASFASFDDSFGHAVDGSFRTVMAYADGCSAGCPRVGRFSNPEVSFAGQPTGIAGARDNAHTGDRTAPVVAGFRDGPEPDSFLLHNPGSELLHVEALVPDGEAPWLSWSPAPPFQVPAGGSREITLAVDPNLLPPGETVRRLKVWTDTASGDPEVTVIAAPAGCDGLYLIDEAVDGARSFAACGTLSAGAETRVGDSGRLTLASASRVVLRDGFSVSAAGGLEVGVEP